MHRVQQISAELVQLYRAQLDIWEPDKLGNVNEAEVLEYDQRRERIGQLWQELEEIITATCAVNQQPHGCRQPAPSADHARLARLLFRLKNKSF